MELSESEKNKIRLEEVYRQEVKKSFEENKSKKSSRIVTFLNTSLGIFILSTIFVSLFSWLYKEYSSYKMENDQKRVSLEKLKVEIPYRISYLKKANQHLFEKEFAQIFFMTSGMGRYIFPEYENRTSFSLIYEYSKKTPNKEKGGILLSSFEKVYDYYEKVYSNPIDTVLESNSGSSFIQTKFYKMQTNDSLDFAKEIQIMEEIIETW